MVILSAARHGSEATPIYFSLILSVCTMIRSPLMAGICALAVVAASSTIAHGQTFTWNGGGGNGNWSAAANWGGTAPVSDPALTLIVLQGATQPTTVVDMGGGTFNINSLSFSGTANFAVNAAGTATTLRIGNGGITMTGGSNLSIANALALSAGQTWANNGSGNNTLTVSGLVNLEGNTLSVGGSGTGATNITGIVSNTGGLTKVGAGSGVVTLSGANTYTGITTVSSGVLATTTLANGGAASGIGQSGNGAANLVLDGGTLRYTGAVISTDRLFTLTLNNSTLEANGSGALTFANAGAIAFTGSGARTFTLGGTSTAANVFTPIIGDGGGATSLVKSGAGRWIMGSTGTYTGTTTISGGTLQYNNIANIPGSGPSLLVNSGGSAGAGFAITQAFVDRIINTSTGAAALAVDSSVNLDFNTGGFTALRLGAAAGTTVNYTGVLTPNGNTYRFGGPAGGTLTLPNVLPDVVIPSHVDVGFGAAGGTIALNGANTYTGTTTILSGGILATSNLGNGGLASGLGQSSNAASNLVLSGGTLRYTGTGGSTDRNFTVNASSALESSGTGAINYTNPAAVVFGPGNRTVTFGGTFSGVGVGPNAASVATNTFAPIISDGASNVTSVTKTGAGTWVLTGANTYTGSTTISAGVLGVNRATAGATPLGTAAVTLSGGTLSFRGTNANPLTVTGFNQDVIASFNDIATPNPFGTTSAVDAIPSNPAPANNQWALMQNRPDFLTAYGLPTTLGLPASRAFNSNANQITRYQLAAYDNGSGGGINNNSLYLSADSTNTGRLTITTPGSFQTVSLLVISGGGASTFNAVLHFTDGSTTPMNGLNGPDWFNNTPFAITDLGRMDRFDGNPDTGVTGGNPRLYPVDINLSSADQAKTLDWIDFTRTGGQRLNVLGISGAAPGGLTSYANPVTLTASSTIEMLNTGSMTLGQLSINGSFTLTTRAFGNTTLTFPSTSITGNPTFAIAAGQTITTGPINFNSAARTVTVAASGLTNGTGTLVLDAAATNATAINRLTVNAGTANVTNITALGNTPNLTVAGGVANMGPYAALNSLTVSSGTANLPSVTSVPTATISGGTTNFTLSPTITTTSVTGGTINFNGGATLGTLTLNSGTASLGAPTTAGQLSGAGGTLALGSTTLTAG